MSIENYVMICKALGDITRLQIIEMLSGKELCACRILENFDITQPTLSHHMRILSKCGIVTTRKDGKWSYYSLNSEVFDAFKSYISSFSGYISL